MARYEGIVKDSKIGDLVLWGKVFCLVVAIERSFVQLQWGSDVGLYHVWKPQREVSKITISK